MNLKSVILLGAVLALSTMTTSAAGKPSVKQTPAPQFNFWSNLREFSWGLTLGIPGSTMHSKVTKCWYDADAFLGQIETAQTNNNL